MLALWREGIYTMVIAYTILNIFWVFVWHFFAHRLMGYRLIDFVKDIMPFAIVAAADMIVTGWCSSMIVYALRSVGEYAALWLLLISRTIIAALIYFAVMRLSGAVILKECIAFITKKKS
jgi:hypothetical protein